MLRLIWHRLRRHDAYAQRKWRLLGHSVRAEGWGYACNTCDKDWLV